jgi:hypothetical protein
MYVTVNLRHNENNLDQTKIVKQDEACRFSRNTTTTSFPALDLHLLNESSIQDFTMFVDDSSPQGGLTPHPCGLLSGGLFSCGCRQMTWQAAKIPSNTAATWCAGRAALGPATWTVS